MPSPIDITPRIPHSTAENILSLLNGLTLSDGLDVLMEMQRLLLAKHLESRDDSSQIVITFNYLPRRKGRLTKAEKDSEVLQFIFSLPPHLTYQQKADRCFEAFGKERAPSRNSIWRLFRRLEGERSRTEIGVK
ncbi:MAG: hypothetical protein KZQ89_01540 [Candidatus Thiodiazotropha sp. (ex Lucinoma kastoroae)]|nr:hypothetical protein [Candidatus Thiodiazotropha sp. (ex Lucinoma kastoroae)]